MHRPARTHSVFTVLVAVLLVLTTRLLGLRPSSAAAEATTPGPAEFRVGVILPLTGPVADYGTTMKNCIELALKDRPDLFRNLRFYFEDAGYDPKSAVLAFRKLTATHNVQVTITWGVPFCKALAPIAEGRQTPLIGICLDPSVSRGRRFVLQFFNTTDEIMQRQAAYLHARGMNRIGILLADNPYLEELSQALTRNLKEGQSVKIIERLPVTEMDLRTNIIRLLKNRDEFDSIGVFLHVGQIAAFYRQAHSLGFDIPTFGHNTFESMSEVVASNGSMNGVVFSNIRVKDDFFTRYRELYHNESQLSFGAPTYELALALGELFNDTSLHLSGAEILDRIAAMPPRDGVAAGPYSYTNDPQTGPHFKFPLAVKKIVNNSITVLE